MKTQLTILKAKKRFSNFENEAFSSFSHESSAGSGLRARGRREPDDRRPEGGLAEGLERRRVHVEQDRGEGAALPGEQKAPAGLKCAEIVPFQPGRLLFGWFRAVLGAQTACGSKK